MYGGWHRGPLWGTGSPFGNTAFQYANNSRFALNAFQSQFVSQGIFNTGTMIGTSQYANPTLIL